MALLQTLLCKVCGISCAHTLYVVLLKGQRTEHLICSECSDRAVQRMLEPKTAPRRVHTRL